MKGDVVAAVVEDYPDLGDPLQDLEDDRALRPTGGNILGVRAAEGVLAQAERGRWLELRRGRGRVGAASWCSH